MHILAKFKLPFLHKPYVIASVLTGQSKISNSMFKTTFLNKHFIFLQQTCDKKKRITKLDCNISIFHLPDNLFYK